MGRDHSVGKVITDIIFPDRFRTPLNGGQIWARGPEGVTGEHAGSYVLILDKSTPDALDSHCLPLLFSVFLFEERVSAQGDLSHDLFLYLDLANHSVIESRREQWVTTPPSRPNKHQNIEVSFLISSHNRESM